MPCSLFVFAVRTLTSSSGQSHQLQLCIHVDSDACIVIRPFVFSTMLSMMAGLLSQAALLASVSDVAVWLFTCSKVIQLILSTLVVGVHTHVCTHLPPDACSMAVAAMLHIHVASAWRHRPADGHKDRSSSYLIPSQCITSEVDTIPCM